MRPCRPLPLTVLESNRHISRRVDLVAKWQGLLRVNQSSFVKSQLWLFKALADALCYVSQMTVLIGIGDNVFN